VDVERVLAEAARSRNAIVERAGWNDGWLGTLPET